MFNFLEFILESNKFGLPYFFSKNLNNFLFDVIKNTDDRDVRSFLYHILDQESKFSIDSDFTFLDMSNKNDTLSFIQSNRVHQIYKDSGSKDNFEDWIRIEKLKEDSMVWKSPLRSESRVGRTFKKIMSNQFDDSVVEKFVNVYKSNYDFKFNIDGRFELINGDNIKYFYLESSYSGRNGQLSNSCMRYPTCQNFFEIYVHNPEVCSLLVLYDSPKREKISGRSLIWKCINGDVYMDRVYTNRDSDINLFYDYAKSKKWTKEWKYDREVRLKKWTFFEYPFMDTFMILNLDTGILSSDDKLWTKGSSNIIGLRETNGCVLRPPS
jgi:hypothetical protein